MLRRYEKVLVPEMNTGQLLQLVRAEFLVDAVGYNRVRGLPFRSAELAEAITALSGVMSGNGDLIQLTAKDFKSDQEVRWCPGCGDYAILAAVQGFMPELGIAREKIVFVSGIGCAARFPYYMETYGMHSIHGRAPAIATGLATARPDLSVWVIGGDGDMLSIGGNHLIHALRRNVNLNILLLNNRIYGLTKGQYSPTSERGKVTKSTPMGSVDQPFNPLSVAIGAEATFVARAIDTDKKELTEVLRAAAAHKGASFVEVFQNCNIYNDGAFDFVREQKENRIYLRGGRADRLGRARRARDPPGARTARPRRATRPRAACSCTIPRTPSRASRSPSPASRTRPSARPRSGSSGTSSARPTTRASPSRSARRASSEARATCRSCSRPGTPGRSPEPGGGARLHPGAWVSVTARRTESCPAFAGQLLRPRSGGRRVGGVGSGREL